MPCAAFSDRSLRYCSCVRLIYDSARRPGKMANLVDFSILQQRKSGITSAASSLPYPMIKASSLDKSTPFFNVLNPADSFHPKTEPE